MVLESLFSADTIEDKPKLMLVLSFFVTLIVALLSYFIFPQYAGIIIPLLVTISMTPLVYDIFTIEEDIERKQARKRINKTFWDRHDETIKILTFFFIGSFLAVFLLMMILPDDIILTIFEPQFNAIEAITGGVTYDVSIAAITSKTDAITLIIMNNFKVMAFSFILSFLFSTGSLFILSWNASILAIFLAALLRKGMVSEFISASIGIIPHAPVEIVAYFFAAIAGGMLSVGFMRERWGSKELNLVLKDSLIMLGLAIVSILIGGGIEVFL